MHMRPLHRVAAGWMAAAWFGGHAAAEPLPVRTHDPPLGHTGPWGVASGAEWGGDYPLFNPLLRDAGVQWLRFFPEWQTIQPRQAEWNWEPADRLVANARENDLRVTGVFAYFAKWASADGGTRRGPVKDLRFWRDYVGATMARYRNDIRHWEVWNEFNGSFYQGVDKPKEYAALTVAAYEEARRIDPDIQVGISVANFDVGFLDAAIKAGAANHFDFVCVHPYENIGAVVSGGTESAYLSLAGSLRRMLTANGQRADIPLWITETGIQAPVAPDPAGDTRQAEGLAKVFVLSMAQGFARVCWFEACGPAYGKGTDHGLIRRDWTPRPAFKALRTLTRLLGPEPAYAGWLNMGTGGYGFLFDTPTDPVLVAWAPPEAEEQVAFGQPIQAISLEGHPTPYVAGQDVRLTRTPQLITLLPANLVEQARANRVLPFPWGTDFSQVVEASCRLGGTNLDRGIQQVRLQTTAVVNGLTESWRRTNFAHGSEGQYAYFRTDPTFVGFGDNALEITVVARRSDPDELTGMVLTYESLTGYRLAEGRFAVPEGDGWHTYTWKVTDANFVGGWGWNFRTESGGSPSEAFLREVRVRRVPATPADR